MDCFPRAWHEGLALRSVRCAMHLTFEPFFSLTSLKLIIYLLSAFTYSQPSCCKSPATARSTSLGGFQLSGWQSKILVASRYRSCWRRLPAPWCIHSCRLDSGHTISMGSACDRVAASSVEVLQTGNSAGNMCWR